MSETRSSIIEIYLIFILSSIYRTQLMEQLFKGTGDSTHTVFF